jgi:hypothetical protein
VIVDAEGLLENDDGAIDLDVAGHIQRHAVGAEEPMRHEKIGAVGTGALELVETRRRHDERDPIEEFAGGLTLGAGADDRAGDGHSVKVDHRSADVHTDRLHAGRVARPNGLVPTVVIGHAGERFAHAGRLQRLADHDVEVPVALDVIALPSSS